jgi:uncharacterized protein YecE (DUF72 family)
VDRRGARPARAARHGAALCRADRDESPIAPPWRTTDGGYLRFHTGAAEPWPRYRPGTLQVWADRLAATYGPDDDVFVYFNNDPGGAAVIDAVVFTGRIPTRVPALEQASGTAWTG